MDLLNYEQQKSIEAIIYIAQKIENVDYYKVLKLLYFADKEHLINYGRTITGDTYYRLEHGPCPTNNYDLIKSRKSTLFTKKLNTDFDVETKHSIVALREPNLDYLSESDIECLNNVITNIGVKGFAEIKELSHDIAYKKARQNKAISFLDIVDQVELEEEYKNYLKEKIENVHAL